MPTELVLPTVLEDARLSELRGRVREFTRAERESGGFVPAVDSWMTAWNITFSRKLAAQGWLGMTIPVQYGGHGAAFLDRFVVTEELLAAGAPVTAHWFADRQIAPSLLKYGTEAQKREFLPRIAAADVLFAVGMSEPDAGSDLANVRSRAVRVEGGWRVSGSKVWTSNAHRADNAIALVRTAPSDSDHRHEGLSQVILDLHAPGIEVRPILSLSGDHHFNEVFLDEVFVPDTMVLGTVGNGWEQVTSELSFERSGPERFLSAQLVLEDLVTAMRHGELPADREVGRFFARVIGLHHMSISVAGALSRNQHADLTASVVKDLGTVTEGDITEYASLHLGRVDPGEATAALRAATEASLLARPGYTLRGGTNEILRSVIARQLGLR